MNSHLNKYSSVKLSNKIEKEIVTKNEDPKWSYGLQQFQESGANFTNRL